MSPTFRVAVYSHDTFGLGHLTRSTRLASAVAEALPRASVLIITGSPIASRFTIPERIDYVKLPSVVKTGPDAYASRELRISPKKVRKLRTQLILDSIRMYRPDLLLVDNVPGGMKGELMPALKSLRRDRPQAQIHLNLRDILDEPEVIRAAWEKARIPALLREHYDAINVFGLPSVYDAIEAYDLPREKTAHLGYIAPTLEEIGEGQSPPARRAGKKMILATTGGGGDGVEILHGLLRMQRHLGAESPYQILMITGPLMRPNVRLEIDAKIASTPGVKGFEYVRGLPRWMAHADLVVSMGGYNTLCEVLAYARRSLVIPRTTPRREQEIRARAFESLGFVGVLDSCELAPEQMAGAIEAALAKPEPDRSLRAKLLQGIPQFKKSLRLRFGGDGNGIDLPGEAPFGRRAARGRIVGSLVLALGLCSAGPAMAGLRPNSLEVEFGAGYDSNLLNASDAELRAFEVGDPGAFFVVDTMSDSFSRSSVQADWSVGRPFGMKTKLRGRYERAQYIGESIKSENAYAVSLQARAGKRDRITLGANLFPQIYGRHRLDKDAVPGAAQFRAETQVRTDLGLEWERRRADGLRLIAGVEGSWRNFNRPFDERDRNRASLRLGLGKGLSSRLAATMEGAVRRSRSRNLPDLGRDLSNWEWVLEPAVEISGIAGLAKLALGAELTRRSYTSQLPGDLSHRGRKDWMGGIELEGSREISPALAIAISYVRNWTSSGIGSGQIIEYDEAGSFSENVVSLSLNWHRQFDS